MHDPNGRPLKRDYWDDQEREDAWGIRRNAEYRSTSEIEKAEKEIKRGWQQIRRGRRV